MDTLTEPAPKHATGLAAGPRILQPLRGTISSGRTEGHRQGASLASGYEAAHLLADPEKAGYYGEPGLLCFPHLQVLVPRLPGRVFERVLTMHIEATRHAAEALDTGEGQGQALSQQVSLEAALHLAVGDRPVNAPSCSLPEAGASGPEDLIQEVLSGISRDRDCPVCSRQRSAWKASLRWLHDADHIGDRVDDLLPTLSRSRMGTG
jgi:hypothetical protein